MGDYGSPDSPLEYLKTGPEEDFDLLSDDQGILPPCEIPQLLGEMGIKRLEKPRKARILVLHGKRRSSIILSTSTIKLY